MPPSLDPARWRAFAEAVLVRAGLPPEPATAVARGLVEADLYGHVTHGLALLADYVDEIAAGTMATEGRPEIVSDAGAAATWDARRLPGVWTTMLAVEDAVSRATRHGVGAVAIRRSHHIACLAAYLEAPARAGNLVLVFSSDPSDAHVAPFGGLAPLITPDPVAAGIPADPDPILVDVSMSITTAGMVAKTAATGGKLRGDWLIDENGRSTRESDSAEGGRCDSADRRSRPWSQGFALGLVVEALTQGLSGFGRAESAERLGCGRAGARSRAGAIWRRGSIPARDQLARRCRG